MTFFAFTPFERAASPPRAFAPPFDEPPFLALASLSCALSSRPCAAHKVSYTVDTPLILANNASLKFIRHVRARVSPSLARRASLAARVRFKRDS